MVHQKPYSCRLVCSQKVKNYINNECIKDFLETHPEMEGANITENMILTHLIKNTLKLFDLENGNHNTN